MGKNFNLFQQMIIEYLPVAGYKKVEFLPSIIYNHNRITILFSILCNHWKRGYRDTKRLKGVQYIKFKKLYTCIIFTIMFGGGGANEKAQKEKTQNGNNDKIMGHVFFSLFFCNVVILPLK